MKVELAAIKVSKAQVRVVHADEADIWIDARRFVQTTEPFAVVSDYCQKSEIMLDKDGATLLRRTTGGVAAGDIHEPTRVSHVRRSLWSRPVGAPMLQLWTGQDKGLIAQETQVIEELLARITAASVPERG